MAHTVAPQLPALLDACRSYHLHSPDGWVTTAGFMTCARKAGLELSRAEYLALERALTKDTMGRINYLQVRQLLRTKRVVCGKASYGSAGVRTTWRLSTTCR